MRPSRTNSTDEPIGALDQGHIQIPAVKRRFLEGDRLKCRGRTTSRNVPTNTSDDRFLTENMLSISQHSDTAG